MKQFNLLITLFILGFSTTQAKELNELQAQQFTQRKSNLSFKENKGQILDQNQKNNTSVLYQLLLPGLNVSLKKNGFSYDAWKAEDLGEDKELAKMEHNDHRPTPHRYNYKFHRVDVEFFGANANCKLTTEGKSTDYDMFYTTGTTEQGAQVFHYEKVIYHDLYNGIDLEFVAQPGTKKPVEYNFIVHPGADAAQIKMRYTGALENSLKNGALVMKLAHTDLTESIPASWLKETKQPIAVTYQQIATTNNSITIGFSTNNFTKEKTLVIDPTPNLEWATYYGGSGNDRFRNIATDKYGNKYVVGETQSVSNIATVGSYQTVYGGGNYDVLLLKTDSMGNRLWASYYGGSGLEYGFGVALDADQNVYLSGVTGSSAGIASTGANDTVYQGAFDGFLAKFDGNGNRLWATYFGGTGLDQCYGLCTNHSGHLFVTGSTGSNTDIATGTVFQPAYGSGSADAFLAEYDFNGQLIKATYLGGTSYDYGISLACDNADNIILCGYTGSASCFNINTSFQPAYGGGGNDAFLTKFSATLFPVWSTYYGGFYNDYAEAVCTDAAGNIYLTGYTNSANAIGTTGSFIQNGFQGSDDGFLVKFKSNGSRLWGTYLGNAGDDYCYAVACDDLGNIAVAGSTSSLTGIATVDAYQTLPGGNQDVYLNIFNSNGSRLWGTYLGGSNDDVVYGVCMFKGQNVVLSGYTASSNYPIVVGAQQSGFGGAITDGVLAGFQFCIPPSPILIEGPDKMCIGNQSYFLTNITSGSWWVADSVFAIIQPNGLLTALQPGTTTVYFSVNNDCATDTVSRQLIINSNTAQYAAVLNYDGIHALCPNSSMQLEAPAGYVYTWNTGDTSQTIDINAAGNYFVILADTNGCTDTSNVLSVISKTMPTSIKIKVLGLATVCEPNTVSFRVDPSASSLYGFDFQWKTGGVAISGATDTAYTTSGVGGGSVTLTVSGSTCSKTASGKAYLIKPLPVATFTAGSSTTICSGELVTLNAPIITGYVYTWLKDGVAVGSGASKSFKLAGNYTVIAKLNGCSDTASQTITITVNPLPVAVITPLNNIVFCAGDSCTMMATPNAVGNQYNWFNGNTSLAITTNPNYTVGTTGTYRVMIKDANQCLSKLSTTNVKTKLNPIPVAGINASSSTTIGINGNVKLKATPSSGVTWQWYKDGQIITGATSNQYIANASGSYTVAITKTGCTGTSAPITVTQTGVKEAAGTTSASSFELNAYPNPVTDLLTINVRGLESIDATIQVMDFSGRLVAMKEMTTSSTTVDMTGYASGMYLIRYKDAEGRTGTIKITKE